MLSRAGKNLNLLVRITILVVLWLPTASNANQPVAPFNPSKIRIEVHAMGMTWNAEPLGSYASLQQECRLSRTQINGGAITIASGLDTSNVQVRRVAKILREDCGASVVIYDVIIRPQRPIVH